MVGCYIKYCSIKLFSCSKVLSMTYKELLFKMGRRGMLTISNDKEGRGLFWVGMNNLESLEKEINLKDFEGEDPPEKEFYTDKQGRKQVKHKNYTYNQHMFREKEL